MMPPRCKLWRLPRRAISRRSTSKEAGIANQTGRETSGSETGTVLSGTNARSGRTVQQHGTGREDRRLSAGLDRAAGRAQPAPRHPRVRAEARLPHRRLHRGDRLRTGSRKAPVARRADERPPARRPRGRQRTLPARSVAGSDRCHPRHPRQGRRRLRGVEGEHPRRGQARHPDQSILGADPRERWPGTTASARRRPSYPLPSPRSPVWKPERVYPPGSRLRSAAARIASSSSGVHRRHRRFVPAACIRSMALRLASRSDAESARRLSMCPILAGSQRIGHMATWRISVPERARRSRARLQGALVHERERPPVAARPALGRFLRRHPHRVRTAHERGAARRRDSPDVPVPWRRIHSDRCIHMGRCRPTQLDSCVLGFSWMVPTFTSEGSSRWCWQFPREQVTVGGEALTGRVSRVNSHGPWTATVDQHPGVTGTGWTRNSAVYNAARRATGVSHL